MIEIKFETCLKLKSKYFNVPERFLSRNLDNNLRGGSLGLSSIIFDRSSLAVGLKGPFLAVNPQAVV